MEDTEEEVDLRPRRPALERRKVERGVRGDGERDCRFVAMGVVCMRLTAGLLCGPGVRRGLVEVGVLEVAGLGLGSFGLFELLDDLRRSGVERVIRFPGDFARLADSRSQCFQ